MGATVDHFLKDSLLDTRDEEMIEAGFLGTSSEYWNAIDEASINFTPGIGFI